jgi:hypothetical protein
VAFWTKASTNNQSIKARLNRRAFSLQLSLGVTAAWRPSPAFHRPFSTNTCSDTNFGVHHSILGLLPKDECKGDVNKGEPTKVKRAHSTIHSFVAIVALCAASASAQGQAGTAQAPAQAQAEPAPHAGVETDIGFNFYEAMNSSTTAQGITETPINAPGGMLEIRQIRSPFIGYEVTYSYNPADETIGPTPAPSCATYCNLPPQRLPSGASTVGLDWIISKKFGALRPFLAGGGGFFIDEPSYSVTVGQSAAITNTYANNGIVRPAFLFGGGVDFSLSRHFGIRAQYRSALYRVPNLAVSFPALGVNTQTQMPMGGIFYAF